MNTMKRNVWTGGVVLAGVLAQASSLAQNPLAGAASPSAAPANTGPAKKAVAPKARLSALPRAKPKSTVKMDFRDAGIDQILNFYSVLSGLTVVKDPGLQGTATLISPRPLTVDQAFSVLSELLDSRGYRMERTPMVVRITPKGSDRGGGFGGQGFGGPGGGGFGGFGGGRSNVQTQVFHLQYASARGVTTVINDLFGNTSSGGANRNGGNRGGGGFQGGFPGGNFNGGGFPGGGPVGFQGGGGNGGANGTGNDVNGSAAPNTGSGGTARASADDYSNSVIVAGTAGQLAQVQAVIEQIDQPVGSSQVTQVFPIRYVSATEMSTVISNVILAAGNTAARSSGSAANLPLEQRTAMSARLGANAATNGQVVASTETNSLIVTASEETLDLVTQVIKELDKPIPVKQTTFVRQLKNASATEVANMLNQLYSRNGTNRTTATTNGSLSNRTNSTSGNSTNRNRSNTGFGGGNSGGNGGGFGGNF